MFWMTIFSHALKIQLLFLVVTEKVQVRPRTRRYELIVLSYPVLEIISIYMVSLDVTIPVVHHIPVLLLIKSVHLEILIGVDQVSPRIIIGSDL